MPKFLIFNGVFSYLRLTETISPVAFLNLRSWRKKYQNRDLATMWSGAKMIILKRGGFGSFSDGNLRPMISYSFNYKRKKHKLVMLGMMRVTQVDPEEKESRFWVLLSMAQNSSPHVSATKKIFLWSQFLFPPLSSRVWGFHRRRLSLCLDFTPKTGPSRWISRQNWLFTKPVAFILVIRDRGSGEKKESRFSRHTTTRRKKIREGYGHTVWILKVR